MKSRRLLDIFYFLEFTDEQEVRYAIYSLRVRLSFGGVPWT